MSSSKLNSSSITGASPPSHSATDAMFGKMLIFFVDILPVETPYNEVIVVGLLTLYTAKAKQQTRTVVDDFDALIDLHE